MSRGELIYNYKDFSCVTQLQTYGDSKLVIDCLTGEMNFIIYCDVYAKIKELERSFNKISYSHVYRELLNVQSDELSKQTLELNTGRFISVEERAGASCQQSEDHFMVDPPL